MSTPPVRPNGAPKVVQYHQAVAQVGGVLLAAGIALFIFTSPTGDWRTLASVLITVLGAVLVWLGLRSLSQYPPN